MNANLLAQNLAESANYDKPVKAIVPQGSNQNLNIRVLAASSDVSKLNLFNKCNPRKQLDGKDRLITVLPEGLKKIFNEANKKMTDWLSKSEDNVKSYLHDPVGALKAAGVELARTDQKELSRNFEEFKSVTLLSPGLNLNQFTTKYKTGTITKTNHSHEDNTGNGDCGCGCK